MPVTSSPSSAFTRLTAVIPPAPGPRRTAWPGSSPRTTLAKLRHSSSGSPSAKCGTTRDSVRAPSPASTLMVCSGCLTSVTPLPICRSTSFALVTTVSVA